MTAKKKVVDELTPRQLKFVQEYSKTGNALQSALKAGYSESYSKVITTQIKGHHGKKSEKIRKSLEEVYEEKGLTPELIVEYLLKDMQGKPGDRIQEIKHASDLLNMVVKKVSIEDRTLPELTEEKKQMLAKLMG